MSKKRPYERPNIDTQLVEIYEDLASESEEARLKAAQALVSRFTPDKKPSTEDVDKALRRLFRGVCSGRKAARLGFGVCLTEILAQVFEGGGRVEIGIENVLDLLRLQTMPEGKLAGQVRD